MKKQFPKFIITFASLTLAISVCLLPAGFLNAAETTDPVMFYFEPDFVSYLDPDYLYLDLKIDPVGQAVNVVGASISYDPAYLQLEASDYSDSFCKLFIPEITDTETGNFYTACGSWQPATSTAAVVRLKFKKLQAGGTKIAFENTEAYIHDGLGTTAATAGVSHYLEIVK